MNTCEDFLSLPIPYVYQMHPKGRQIWQYKKFIKLILASRVFSKALLTEAGWEVLPLKELLNSKSSFHGSPKQLQKPLLSSKSSSKAPKSHPKQALIPNIVGQVNHYNLRSGQVSPAMLLASSVIPNIVGQVKFVRSG